MCDVRKVDSDGGDLCCGFVPREAAAEALRRNAIVLHNERTGIPRRVT